jgi:hypothetical protein
VHVYRPTLLSSAYPRHRGSGQHVSTAVAAAPRSSNTTPTMSTISRTRETEIHLNSEEGRPSRMGDQAGRQRCGAQLPQITPIIEIKHDSAQDKIPAANVRRTYGAKRQQTGVSNRFAPLTRWKTAVPVSLLPNYSGRTGTAELWRQVSQPCVDERSPARRGNKPTPRAVEEVSGRPPVPAAR